MSGIGFGLPAAYVLEFKGLLPGEDSYHIYFGLKVPGNANYTLIMFAPEEYGLKEWICQTVHLTGSKRAKRMFLWTCQPHLAHENRELG